MTNAMTKVLAICLEDVLAEDPDKRYLCCTVKNGRSGGLSVDNKGTTQWMVDKNPAFQLFFTREDTLGLYRLKNGAAVQVRRGRRTLDAPFEKPVILRHKDELVIAGRHYRVHVHGEVKHTYAPYFFKQQISNVAAATVLGAALTLGACSTVDGDTPPNASADTDTNADGDTGTDTDTYTDTFTDAYADTDTGTGTGALAVDTDTETDTDTIDVRLTPPE